MKNFEKYENEVREYNGDNFCEDFVLPRILKKDNCAGIYCSACAKRQLMWFLEEYEEPETDWSKVEVDTPILVRNDGVKWVKRHFAKYENGLVYAWKDSCTSWTTEDITEWDYAKLAKDEEECKDPEVDWNEVKIDTPILVRDSENGDWFKRYFAEYKNGKIYTWDNGHTSWETSRMIEWKYAKLVEDGEERKELGVDWSEVNVDTPVLVRDHEDTESVTVPWLKRYFAEYKDGLVYTWINGRTSWNEDCTHWWKYAKLAEDEE